MLPSRSTQPSVPISRDDALVVARLLGLMRVVVGVAALAAPRLLARMLLLDRDVADASTLLVRMFGVRDAVLGVGALLADGEVEQAWVRAGALSDAADALAITTDRSRLRSTARILVGLSAAGAAGTALLCAARLRDT